MKIIKQNKTSQRQNNKQLEKKIVRSYWSAGSLQANTYETYYPNNVNILVSDNGGVAEQSATRLRFLRPIVDGNGFQHCAPGARVSFVTNANYIRLQLYWNALVTRLDTFNSTGSILVNGQPLSTFECPFTASVAGVHTPIFNLPPGSKTVSIIWPYGAGLDLEAISIEKGASMTTVTRPSRKLVAAGDSITHGYTVPKTIDSYAYKLAELKNSQIVNLANGSEGANALNGNAVPLGLNALDRIIYFIGFNNFYPQTSVPSFQSEVGGWITNARARAPLTPIYVGMHRTLKVAADYGGTIEPATYRAAVQAAELAAGDANTFYIDGHAVVSNNPLNFVDGIHFNSVGAASAAAYLSSIL